MTQELSTLMDGELDGQEAGRVIRGCCGDEELRRKWQDYHVIGDALRGDLPRRDASTQRILAALADEPTVLAPRRLSVASAGRIAFAAAASVATVAVVGWIGLQDRAAAPAPAIASKAPVAPVVAARDVGLSAVNEYVDVHRQLPAADFYRPVANRAPVGR